MDTELRQGVEALLFVAPDPIELPELARVLERDEDDVLDELQRLSEEYVSDARGLAVRRVAGGWRMYTAPPAHDVVERWVLSGRSGRLTQAALETLAVVAYKQPITRQEVGEIRGVDADAAVRSLAARGFVEEVGRDDGPGQAILFGTTTRFLEQMGLDSVDDLPPLTSFMPDGPAPDEPSPGEHKEARQKIKEGEGDGSPLPPITGSEEAGDAEMDELTDSLERVARSAIDNLRRVVAATDETSGGDPGEEADGTDEPQESEEAGAPTDTGRSRRQGDAP